MKTNLIPIALTVIVAYSCSPYERSHIEMRGKSHTANVKQIGYVRTQHSSNAILANVIFTIQNSYFDSFQYDPKSDTSVEAVFMRLDPYSYYQTPDEVIKHNQRYEFIERTDLGLTLSSLRDTPVITSIMPYTFAHQRGLLPGDRVIYINDNSTIGSDIDSIEEILSYQSKVRGNVGVYRPSEDRVYFLRVEDFQSPTQQVVFYRMLNDSIGYLYISSFIVTTYSQVRNALQRLENYGMRRLILDVRGNPGGLLMPTMNVVNLFFDEDSPALMLESRAHPGNNSTYRFTYNGLYSQLPLVLLVSNGSASASEVIAGIMQDKDRALIVGETTWGKAVCQNPRELPKSQGTVILTTSRLILPSGRCIQIPNVGNKRGSTPVRANIFINNIDHAFERQFVKDTMKYSLTQNGRKVYGGLGVVPDYLVPRYSNSSTSNFINVLYNLDTLGDYVQEYHQKLYRELPSPTKFYTGFPGTKEGKELQTFIKTVPVDSTINESEISYKEVMRYLTLSYSTNVYDAWAYTKDALLESRQVQFAMSLLASKKTGTNNKAVKFTK